jgi:DNA-binding response OmpR family regulator
MRLEPTALPPQEDNLAATHRSLWLGSRPRPATGYFFVVMKDRILLADGDEPVRRMLARVLESAGYVVLHASTVSQAANQLHSVRPDLLLLDMQSPKDDGWLACETITHTAPNVPVIVITSWPNQSELALERGVHVLMEKPLDMSLLLKNIQELLHNSKTSATVAA